MEGNKWKDNVAVELISYGNIITVVVWPAASDGPGKSIQSQRRIVVLEFLNQRKLENF